ncbi:MAG: YcxB family protein [Lachnospiraceae bacterium]|nr:YcxB family protein [Lachnospiraceae bacterium]
MKQEVRAKFKVSFTPNTEALIQSCRRMVFHITDAQASGLFISIFVLLGLTVVPQMIAHKPGVNADNATLFWILVVLFVLLILVYFVLPSIYAKATMENLMQGKPHATVFMDFYEDALHVRNSAVTGKNILSYEVFTRCAETNELFLLQNANRQTLVLPKANLTGGSVEEFKAFLQKKCTKAKILWKRVLA